MLHELLNQIDDAEEKRWFPPGEEPEPLRLSLVVELGMAASNFEKLCLVSTLAAALSSFYKTPMIARLWTEDTIEIVGQYPRQMNGGYEKSNTLISAPAADPEPEDPVLAHFRLARMQSWERQKFPEVKAFGVLVLQILLKMSMVRLSERYPEYFQEWNGD